MRIFLLTALSMFLVVTSFSSAHASEWLCPQRMVVDLNEFEAMWANPGISEKYKMQYEKRIDDRYNAWVECQNEHMKYDAEQARIAAEHVKCASVAPQTPSANPLDVPASVASTNQAGLRYACQGTDDVLIYLMERPNMRMCAPSGDWRRLQEVQTNDIIPEDICTIHGEITQIVHNASVTKVFCATRKTTLIGYINSLPTTN